MLSISSIEESVRARRENGQKLARVLPLEYAALFEHALEPGVSVIKVWCEINMMDVENVLSEVRSRLLDFMLELRDVVGIDVPEKDLATKAASFDTEKAFTTTIMGSGNTIIIGSHSIQAITNQKDDLEGLVKTIAELGFKQAQLEELRRAVIEDKAHGKTPDVAEGKTGQWFTKALKDAGKGIVKGGIDVVSSVIVKAMKAYTDGTS